MKMQLSGLWDAAKAAVGGKCIALDANVTTAASGRLGGSAVWCLPLAQGVILESRDQVKHRAPCMEPASASACVSPSLPVSLNSKSVKS